MFMFASFGVQIVGGKLAACNDPMVTAKVLHIISAGDTVALQANCTGVFFQKIFVTRMDVYGKNDENMHPKILVPRVWYVCLPG